MKIIFSIILILVFYPTVYAETLLVPESKKLTILTTYSESYVKIFIDGFKKKYPDIDIVIVNRKTPSAIDYIQSNPSLQPDIFWATSPDAFELLKNSGYLSLYQSSLTLKALSLDKDFIEQTGHYTPFAVSGIGLLYNKEQVNQNTPAVPNNWAAMKDSNYYRRIGMSAPSRSGTTHLIVETLFQQEGWQAGWRTLMELAGNLATVTARSYGVVQGVENGLYDFGLVMDSVGNSINAKSPTSAFSYFDSTPLIPANIAILKNSKNITLASQFVEFMISASGQKILLNQGVYLKPILFDMAESAKKKRSNVSSEKHTLNSPTIYDVRKSTIRYYLVNSLFDILVTFQIEELNKIWRNIHLAESKLAKNPNQSAAKLIVQARDLVTYIPVTESQSLDRGFNSTFTYKRWGRAVSKQQVALEKIWTEQVNAQNTQALVLTDKALSILALSAH